MILEGGGHSKRGQTMEDTLNGMAGETQNRGGDTLSKPFIYNIYTSDPIYIIQA
jgi:hypothetical protein